MKKNVYIDSKKSANATAISISFVLSLVLAQIDVPRNSILIFRRVFPFSLHYKTDVYFMYFFLQSNGFL